MMKGLFNLNKYFDEDYFIDDEFLNFDYNDFDMLTPIPEIEEPRFIAMESIEITFSSAHSRLTVQEWIPCSETPTPPPTPRTPSYEYEDDLEELPIFIDECDQGIQRPSPMYKVVNDDTAEELSSVPRRS
jgi:hypothetical protein